jgi:hypothetical protein
MLLVSCRINRYLDGLVLREDVHSQRFVAAIDEADGVLGGAIFSGKKTDEIYGFSKYFGLSVYR